jgi:hypothetical protein
MGSFYRATLGGNAFANSDVHADFSINLMRRKSVEVGSKLPVRLPNNFIQVYTANGA